MYLHLGQSVAVPHREILGIFDLDNASWAYKTREFLERAEREGRAVWLGDDLPDRSFWWGTETPRPPSISLNYPPQLCCGGWKITPLSNIYLSTIRKVESGEGRSPFFPLPSQPFHRLDRR